MARTGRALPGALTANTESCFSSSVLWHDGQANSVDSRTSSSK